MSTAAFAESDRPPGRRGSLPVTIRRAAPADAHVVQTMLLELADRENAGSFVRVTASQWQVLLVHPRVVVFLAETRMPTRPGRWTSLHGSHRMAVGYVSATGAINLWRGRDVLALDDLYVRNAYRDQGVGDQLISALTRHAAAHRLTITRRTGPHGTSDHAPG